MNESEAKARLRLALQAVLATATPELDPDTGEESFWIPKPAIEGLRVALEHYEKSTKGGM